MATTNKPPSKLLIILMWLLMVGMIVFWVVFWLWRNHANPPSTQEIETKPAGIAQHSIISLFIGGFFLVGGGMAYALAVFTGCLTFSYNKPVWTGVKVRMYFANIIVIVLLALGAGFFSSAFLAPFLMMLGLNAGMANLVPVMLMLGIVQVVFLWVLLWSPLERRIIKERLKALGIAPAQLQNATLVGLSNPVRSSFKKFGAVEEDMGALWVGPEQLIYWGDGEQFGIAREQVVEIGRSADAGSTSVLGGISHVILHVRLADGNIRQIRLHTEGIWTMGGKRRAMDALAEAINNWHFGN
jgi:hypothetical protein